MLNHSIPTIGQNEVFGRKFLFNFAEEDSLYITDEDVKEARNSDNVNEVLSEEESKPEFSKCTREEGLTQLIKDIHRCEVYVMGTFYDPLKNGKDIVQIEKFLRDKLKSEDLVTCVLIAFEQDAQGGMIIGAMNSMASFYGWPSFR